MDQILLELGLSDVTELFTLNSITPSVVLNLTEDEYKTLGIQSIGDRVRLRERCRDYTTASEFPEESPVMKRLRSLQKSRKEKTKSRTALNAARKRKETRRICMGWKHYEKGTYRLVTANKGGGIFHEDVNKSASLEEATSTFVDKYFPNGINEVTGLLRDDLIYYIANFTGTPLPSEITFGKPFTLGAYLDTLTSSPVRLYLHTKYRSISTTIESSTQFTVTCDDTTSSPLTGTSPDSDFEETDTPTIFFQRRNRLRLRRRLSNVHTSDMQRSPTNAMQQQTDIQQVPADVQQQQTDIQQLPSDVQQRQTDIQQVPADVQQQQTDIQQPPADVQQQQTDIQQPPADVQQQQTDILQPQADVQQPSTAQPSMVNLDEVNLIEDAPNRFENGPLDFSLQSILKWWIDKTLVPSEATPMLVKRDSVLKSTLRIVRRDDFNFCRPFHVTFSGEDGDDLGGPQREFLRLLVSEAMEDILLGPTNNKFFIHDLTKLSKNSYEMAGQLVAFSLLHGGPGIPVLNPALYQYMTDREMSDFPAISDCIFDQDTRQRLETIEEASTQEEYSKLLQEHSDWCSERGLSVYHFREIASRENLLKVLVKNEIIYSVHTEIGQFIKGLNKVGRMHDSIQLAPEAFEELFISKIKPVNFQTIRSLYKVVYSQEGSNYKRMEKDAIYCLEAFLADCEGGATGIKLEAVLGFWTGATSLPPLGFPKPLQVTFGARKQLPTAHTCNIELNIWRGYTDPDEFCNDMERAITWSGGFHLV